METATFARHTTLEDGNFKAMLVIKPAYFVPGRGICSTSAFKASRFANVHVAANDIQTGILEKCTFPVRRIHNDIRSKNDTVRQLA